MDNPTSRKLRALALLALLPALVRCQPAKYAEHTGSSTGGSNSGSGTVVREYETKVADQNFQPPAVDITWVIDNSGSMNEEAAHVRSNFMDFISSVNLDADLKVALISRAGDSGTAVRLPVAGPNALQLDFFVNSRDALDITAAAVCPKNPGAGTQCRAILDNAITPSLNTMEGTLNGFIRPNSKKAFIIVTDDETRITGEQFLGAFNEVWPGQKPIVYGFVGLGAQSPCEYATGVRYQSLVAATDGVAYNICDANWNTAFSELASHVIRLASVPVVVPVNITTGAQLIAVELNGQPLTPNQYTVTKDGIYIAPALLRGLTEATVRVRYQVTAP